MKKEINPVLQAIIERDMAVAKEFMSFMVASTPFPAKIILAEKIREYAELMEKEVKKYER